MLLYNKHSQTFPGASIENKQPKQPQTIQQFCRGKRSEERTFCEETPRLLLRAVRGVQFPAGRGVWPLLSPVWAQGSHKSRFGRKAKRICSNCCRRHPLCLAQTLGKQRGQNPSCCAASKHPARAPNILISVLPDSIHCLPILT